MTAQQTAEPSVQQTVADYLAGLPTNAAGTPIGCVDRMADALAQEGVFLTRKQRDKLVIVASLEMYAMAKYIKARAAGVTIAAAVRAASPASDAPAASDPSDPSDPSDKSDRSEP